MVPELDIRSFAAARADGATVIDVREPAEYLSGHVPGARPIPLSAVAQHASDLPANRPVYVICASGNRSLRAAEQLRSRGIEAISVAGGTSEWISQGRPVVRGPQADEAAA